MTLLEVVLAMALLAAIAAMAWPSFGRAFEGQRLRYAADQVRAEIGAARAEAINSGRVQSFQYEPESEVYLVQPWQGAEATPQTDQFGLAPEGAEGAASVVVRGKLPEGLKFVATEALGGAIPAGMSAIPVAKGTVSADQAMITPDSPTLLFFPDGTSRDAEVWLSNERGRSIPIRVRGITGASTVGEVGGGQEPTQTTSPRRGRP